MATNGDAVEMMLGLLQKTYFDGIDGADADKAASALHDDIHWAHTQVWEHHGHDRKRPDALKGRAAVHAFLAKRIGDMQEEGIEHKVRQAVCDGEKGAFRAEVVGPTGKAIAFFGWVEIQDGKIKTYIVGPEPD